jgi:hypothetical protein
MGFVSETLAGVTGIQWYYIVGIILFIILFFSVLVYTYKIPKKNLIRYKTSIFEKDELNIGKKEN